MSLQVTNTLTRKKEPFVPMKPGEVQMYVCGPTVYNFIHVGNARPLIFFDVVRRYLEFSGFKVKHVMNFTDVDDKIINRAREEKRDSFELASHFADEYNTDMVTLGVRRPHLQPKVTTHIPHIIKLIEGLVANGAAYVAEDGEVFFSVRGFKEYGKLSGKNVDDLLVGARVDANEKKRDPLDFSLWKPRKRDDEPAWDSPWAKGRPGWHIECSAMALEHLGESFDIHGGGMDLMHPHHENEIAQTEAFTHKPFVKYWLHNNMLTINAEKMSKSLGNFFLTREFLNKYGAETLKFLLLSAHYRSTVDFSERHIRDSQAALHRVYTTIAKCEALRDSLSTDIAKPLPEKAKLIETQEGFKAKWIEAMDDDFNTAKVFGLVFEYVRQMNTYVDKKGFKATWNTKDIVTTFLDDLRELSAVINVFAEEPKKFLGELKRLFLIENGMKESDITDLIAKRVEARAAKDFKTSDSIRADLLAKGVELRDLVTGGTDWDIVFVPAQGT